MVKSAEEEQLEAMGRDLVDQLEALDPENDAAIASAVAEKMQALVLASKPVIQICWDDDGKPSGGDKYRVEVVKDEIDRFVLREFDTAAEAEEFGLGLAEFIYPQVKVERGEQDVEQQ